MPKDFEDKDTQSASFRDQILRELEELKSKRQNTDSDLPSRQDIVESLQESTEKKQATPTHLPLTEALEQTKETAPQTIRINKIAFEDEVGLEETKVIPKIAEDLLPKAVEVDLSVKEEEVEQPPIAPEFSQEEGNETVEPPLEDTVERSLQQLRTIAAGMDYPEIAEEEPLPQTEPMILPPLEDEPVFTRDEVEVAPAVTPQPEPVTPVVEKEEPLARRRGATKQVKKKQDKTAKKIVGTIVSLVALALVATLVAGFFYVKSSLEPVNVEASETIQVEIPEGSSTSQIGQILLENKLIKNATVFNYFSKLKSYNSFQSGFYNLNQAMSVEDLAKKLQEGGTPVAEKPASGKILVIEGYTIEQIAQAITQNSASEDEKTESPFSSDAFMATVQDPAFITRMTETYPDLFASLPAADSGVKYQLEGYLFPATYEYYEDTTIEQLVEDMIAATNTALKPYYAELPNKGLDVNSVLTMASLVEKEGSTDEDRRNIASTFYNRMNIGMPLQSNIAVLYAMGKLGEKTTLAEDAGIDTAIDSPYNNYVHLGLMPGPVGSPSLAAIQATINPNQTDYLYFVADVTTGEVYFTASFDEHNQNVETHVNSKLNNQ
ncbi:endolytic transglycosylase MltG [Streptococcus sp. A11]|uniref:endolytic transglycosylase MltG n=1 Tax=Streptococcus sp. A11 TaxID=3373124 RepID=UPI00374DE08A